MAPRIRTPLRPLPAAAALAAAQAVSLLAVPRAQAQDIKAVTVFGWQTGQTRAHGLFKNIDKSRRLGVEAALAGSYERWRWNINHTWTRATFEDDFDVLSPNHPANALLRGGDGDDDDLFNTRPVRAGAEIPGIPDHLFKAAVEHGFSDRLSAGLELLAVAGSHLRGDESNELDKLQGFATVNARANYRGSGSRRSSWSRICSTGNTRISD